MVSPYHKIENAKTILENIQKMDEFEVLSIEEELGHAYLEFEVKDNSTLSMLKGVDERLRETGWEECSDSELGESLKYEWDKKVLSEHRS